MTYEYKTKGTCSTDITFDIEDNKVHNVHFTGGCNGNLKAVASLVEGLPVDEVISRLEGSSVDLKAHPAETSAHALIEASQK